jgi:hypothetical protein
MSRHILSAVGVTFVSGLIVFAWAGESLGQVWVGGGGVRVRAPFVRVDVGPYGGVSVRAPFTSIDVPGRAYYYEPYPAVIQERVVEPSFPTAAEFASMDDARLTEQLFSIANSLNRRLSRFDTGPTWQRYLRFPEESLASADLAVRREALIGLLAKFQKVSADAQYSMIARLPAFVAMEAALMEAVSRPDGGAGAIETPVEAEELPLPEMEKPLPPPRRPVPPQEPATTQPAVPPQGSLPPQSSLSPRREGPFLRPK